MACKRARSPPEQQRARPRQQRRALEQPERREAPVHADDAGAVLDVDLPFGGDDQLLRAGVQADQLHPVGVVIFVLGLDTTAFDMMFPAQHLLADARFRRLAQLEKAIRHGRCVAVVRTVLDFQTHRSSLIC